ncbi:hypothetical protein [Ectobacillus ponti]|nr:hypothetical protein [Ectobacillus ponti]
MSKQHGAGKMNNNQTGDQVEQQSARNTGTEPNDPRSVSKKKSGK